MDNKTIGQIICEYRKHKGLTQKALAEQLNVTDKAVSKWERDIARPDINTVPKLSEILEVPVEMLISIPLNSKVAEEKECAISDEEEGLSKAVTSDKAEETRDHKRELHKKKAKRLLIKGILGFVVGFLFVLITTLSDNESFELLRAFGVGVLMAGVPFGWELMGKAVGRWYVVGPIPVMILVFCFKLVGAVMIGWAAYPVALFFNIMRAQRKGSTARKIWAVIFGIFIVIMLVFAYIALFASSAQKNSAEGQTAPVTTLTANQYAQIEASVFSINQPEYIAICEKTMDLCKEDELDYEESGSAIVEPSTIQAVYYLSVKEPNRQHVDYGKNVKFTNAVVIATCCRVNIANWVERDNWCVWVYPDFYLDSENILTHEREKEHAHYIGEKTLNEVYEFICEEYQDMEVHALIAPPLS